MLTAHVGPQLRELLDDGASAPAWDEIVALLAELQIDLANHVGELLALGTPDRRPDRLPAAYEELVEHWRAPTDIRALAPRVIELARELGSAVPVTVAHEEVHDGNVFVRDGRAVLIDWGEACVSHPFIGLVNTLHRVADRGGDVDRVRDAYLEPWTQFAGAPELRCAFRAAYRLGHVARLLTWDAILRPLPSGWETDNDPIAGWFGLFAEAVAQPDTLDS